MSDPRRILDAVIGEIEARRRAALCVIVATRGSTPQHAGAMLAVDEDARITGTLGGGCTEAEIRRKAHALLSAGAASGGAEEPRRDVASSGRAADLSPRGLKSAAHPVNISPGGLFTFDLDNETAADDGLICGGHMDVAIQVFSRPEEIQLLRQAVEHLRAGQPATLPIKVATSTGPAEYRVNIEAVPKLLVAGGGHIGKVLADMMVTLGFRVSVVDDRADFANARRLAPPIEPVVGDIGDTLKDWPIDANTYVVIVTRGHKHDEQALAAVINSSARYIGMIGSRRKIAVIFEELKHRGVAAERLDRVHAPIGVDIHAVTPEEIAVSIAAELVSVRRTVYGRTVEGLLAAVDDAD